MRATYTFLACAAVAALIGCGNGETTTDAAPPVRPAKIVTVQSASNERDFSSPAVIRAAQSAELTFQTAGEIRKLNVLEAQDIEKGAVIAELDQRNARNNLDQARAEYRNAEAEYRRAERLLEQDAISESVRDARRTQRDVARVAVANAEKALADTTLVAPFTGVISRVYPQQFQNVQAKEPIAVIQSVEVEAVSNVPGTIIAQVPQLEPVDITVALDAAPEIAIPATFKEASGLADENTQTYEATYSFSPPEGLLILPGMTATVRSTLRFNGSSGILPVGIAAPLSSVLAEGDDRFLWIVDPEEMTISKRKVEIGSDAGETVIVTAGLEGGEQIIAAGVSFLHEGMRVRPWTPE